MEEGRVKVDNFFLKFKSRLNLCSDVIHLDDSKGPKDCDEGGKDAGCGGEETTIILMITLMKKSMKMFMMTMKVIVMLKKATTKR